MRDLAAAERFGQSTAAFGGNPQLEILLAQHLAIEEADSRQLLVAGAVGHLLHRDQVMQKVADLLQGDLLGRAAVDSVRERIIDLRRYCPQIGVLDYFAQKQTQRLRDPHHELPSNEIDRLALLEFEGLAIPGD